MRIGILRNQFSQSGFYLGGGRTRMPHVHGACIARSLCSVFQRARRRFLSRKRGRLSRTPSSKARDLEPQRRTTTFSVPGRIPRSPATALLAAATLVRAQRETTTGKNSLLSVLRLLRIHRETGRDGQTHRDLDELLERREKWHFLQKSAGSQKPVKQGHPSARKLHQKNSS